jgi:hypothetical protein
MRMTKTLLVTVLTSLVCVTLLAGETTTLKTASGTFQVKLAPQSDGEDADSGLGRLTIDKVFSGELTGTSKGQMLSAMTATDGSAGYVAIERVRGTLGGRTGTFILQHSGTLTRGAPQLSVSVVPDSGDGELTGITGTMTIDITGGRHAYVFEYALPDVKH